MYRCSPGCGLSQLLPYFFYFHSVRFLLGYCLFLIVSVECLCPDLAAIAVFFAVLFIEVLSGLAVLFCRDFWVLCSCCCSCCFSAVAVLVVFFITVSSNIFGIILPFFLSGLETFVAHGVLSFAVSSFLIAVAAVVVVIL